MKTFISLSQVVQKLSQQVTSCRITRKAVKNPVLSTPNFSSKSEGHDGPTPTVVFAIYEYSSVYRYLREEAL
jgi:hypothetical protein